MCTLHVCAFCKKLCRPGFSVACVCMFYLMQERSIPMSKSAHCNPASCREADVGISLVFALLLLRPEKNSTQSFFIAAFVQRKELARVLCTFWFFMGPTNPVLDVTFDVTRLIRRWNNTTPGSSTRKTILKTSKEHLCLPTSCCASWVCLRMIAAPWPSGSRLHVMCPAFSLLSPREVAHNI